jgi:PLP dependent protein
MTSTDNLLSSHEAEAIASRIEAVRRRIVVACERTGREPSAVTLIAVSKTVPPQAVAAAARAGITDFGENRVQEGARKALELRAAGVEPTWHLIGHLQTNKVRAAVGAFAILQAVDSERLLTAISACAGDTAGDARVRVMLEVNVSGEASKFGVTPAGLTNLVSFARSLPGISVEGLMTVAPVTSAPDEIRAAFRTLRELALEHSLPSLSMGMSNDYEVAIEEGATHVRVGRAIFGERS